MTTDSVPAAGDARRLLAEVRDLTRQVRVAQRVTWLPLLVLAVVTFGAIPVYRLSRPVTYDCYSVDAGDVCRVFHPAEVYWLVALAVAYVVIARGYLRVARERGVGTRVLPYVITGGVLAVVVFLLLMLGAGAWIADPQELLDPSTGLQVLFRLLTAAGAIGLGLLVLAWLERRITLLLVAAVYLLVVLMPVSSGWGGQWADAPQLALNGAVLLAASAGYAVEQRLRRPR